MKMLKREKYAEYCKFKSNTEEKLRRGFLRGGRHRARAREKLRMGKLKSQANGRVKKGRGVERVQGRERRGRRRSRQGRGETSERVGWERNEKGQ
jgi:hypothetical protein